MDCRTFHKDLEDYLQDELDFAGRFGMERHAQQCFDCGKELTDAQKLHRLAAGLARVKAPENFESGVSEAIVRRRTQGWFHRIRNYWNYSFEWSSWQRPALATSALAVMGIVLFFAMHRDTVPSSVPLAAVDPLSQTMPEKIEPVKVPKTSIVQTSDLAELQNPVMEGLEPDSGTSEVVQDRGLPRMQSVDYLLVGPDNRPMPDRLPNRIYMRYGPPSEEAFIQNVSH